MSDLHPLRRAPSLRELVQSSGQLWRGDELAQVAAQPSGFAALDARLPGGGWPLGALIEIAPSCEGLGEVRLTLPALKSWGDQGRIIAFVKPPHIPYAPALVRLGIRLAAVLWIEPPTEEDAHWAAEQLLREGAAAVLLWSAVAADRALRRLQLAAEAGKACAFLYRTPATLRSASPAAVRIVLTPEPAGVCAQLLKVRGGQPGRVLLPLQSAAS